MIKKLLPFIILIVVAVPVIIILLPQKEKESGIYESGPIDLVPEDAFWVLESAGVPDLLAALSQSDPLFPALQMFGGSQPYLLALKRIDSLVLHNGRLKGVFSACPVTLSLHQTGRNMFQFLLVIKTTGGLPAYRPEELLTELGERTGQWSERNYNGQRIRRISFGAEALFPGMSLAEFSDYLVISPSPILLENTVRQHDLHSGLSGSRSFRKLWSTREEGALAHLLVNLKMLPGWLGSMMNQDVQKKMNGFGCYGDWALLDIRVKNDALWLTGFALEGDTLSSYLGIFKDQEPKKLLAEQFLPSNTAAYYSVGIDKPAAYFRDLSDFVGGGETGRHRQRALDQAVQQSREDVLKTWGDLGLSELTIGFLAGAADESVSAVTLCFTRNPGQTREKLLSWLDAVSGKKSGKGRQPLQRFTSADGSEFDVYPVPFDHFPEILGGDFFSAVRGTCFSFAGNALVLADDLQTIQDFLNFYADGRVLANDPFYRSISDLVSTRSNVTFYAVPHKIRPLLGRILSQKSMSTLAPDKEFMRQTGAVCLQFHSRNGMLLHNIFVRFTSPGYGQPQAIWESRLESRVSGTPAWVINHLTGDQEIAVRDDMHNFYLLNSSGRILWRKKIGEPVNSQIYQVDMMKNGRLQFLFSTPSAIYLLDRNGNSLPGFPLVLASPATSGVSLVDFDNTRDYRLFIACSDKKILCLDKKGNPVKSWKPIETEGMITQPVRHFKIQNQDYLVCSDDFRIYFFDRKGALKIPMQRDIPLSANNPAQYDPQGSGNGFRFLVTDVEGNLCAIGPDGNIEVTTRLDKYGPGHFFVFDDINRDGSGEYLFLDRNRLDIYSLAGEKIVSKKLDGTSSGAPAIYQVDGQVKRIGITLSDKGQILLLNPDGSVGEGFPVRGSSGFALSQSNKEGYRNLVVGSDDNFLFNYALK